MSKNEHRYDSPGSARSFVRDVACQLSEVDPTLMMNFFKALDVARAALVSWLIEEKCSENLPLRTDSAFSEQFLLAVEELRTVLAKLKRG